MTTLTKEQVRAALAELYAGRSKADGFRYVRTILARFNATSIRDLLPEHYAAVFATVRGSRTTPSTPEPEREPWDTDDTDETLPVPLTSARVRTPLVIDLEKRLAARANLPRQKPTMPVDLGNRSMPGDRADDLPPPVMPPGEKMA